MSTRKIFNEACGGGSREPFITGSDCEAIESLATMYFLSKADFKAPIEDMRDLDKVKELIRTKQIVPMFDLYELNAANTDASTYESGNFSAETKRASKGLTFEHYLGFTSHSALKSYEGSVYTKYIEVTDEGYLLGVYDTDGESFTGQTMSSFEVGMRMPSTKDKPAYTTVTIKFDDSNELEDGAIHFKPNYNPNIDVEGIFEVEIVDLVATVAQISFSAKNKASGVLITGDDLNFVFSKLNIYQKEHPDFVSSLTSVTPAVANGNVYIASAVSGGVVSATETLFFSSTGNSGTSREPFILNGRIYEVLTTFTV